MAVLVVAFAMLPAYGARAQDEPAQPAGELPPSLVEQFAAAPGLVPAAVPEGVELPANLTAADLAQMPDRTRYAVVGYKVEGGVVNATVLLPATQTTYIASGAPNTNFGSQSFLNLGWAQSGANAMRMLVQFDLSLLPANAQIDRARFFINQSAINPTDDSQAMSFRAQLMQQSWNANTATWNNANFLGGLAFPLGSIPPALGLITGDATGVVRAWDSGEPNRGLIITGDERPNPARFRQFFSRAVPALAPYLEVDLTVNCDTAPPVAQMEPLPAISPGEFRAFWSAVDPNQPGCPASGVAWFNVRYRIDGGSWVNWRNQTPNPSFTFRGWAPNNSVVDFQVQAADNAGNRGPWSASVSTRIDSQPPVASVNPLPQYTVTPNFDVTWSGSDNLAGIAFYNLQMSRNGGDWQTLVSETPATSFQVTGAQTGDVLGFRVQAVDNVGNVQPWSSVAQATTTVFVQPIAIVQPFDPAIIKPTSPVTDVIPVRWTGIAAPGTTIVTVELRYRFTGFRGTPGAWTTWNTFPGTTLAADFDYAALGLGNGHYDFFALATNNRGQTQTFDPESGTGASVTLDLNDEVQTWGHLPIVASN
jgi:hypothetical protein